MKTAAAFALCLTCFGCGIEKGEGQNESSLKADNITTSAWQERTLDRVTFLTAHNAFANNGDDARFIAPNQEWGLTKQMEMGVRGFMLDIWSKNGEAVLCHGRCGLAGLFPWISLTDELRRFEDFMKKNPDAIITLHLEWTGSARVNEIEEAFNAFPDLKNMIMNPYAWDVRKNGWPKIKDMIAQNKRLLVLSQTDATRHLGFGWDQELTVENYWSMGTLANDRECRTRWDHIPLDADNTQSNRFRRLFVMNHFRDVPTILTAALDNTWGSLYGRVETNCLLAARRIPNYVALDFVNKGTGRETVDTLNRAVGIAFQHGGWQGQTHLILDGSTNVDGGDGKMGDNSLSSVELFFRGTHLAIFDDRDQHIPIGDVTETTANIGALNDKASSWRVWE